MHLVLLIDYFLTGLMYPFESTEKSHLDVPLEENVNRIVPEEGTVEARTIEDAIAVLRYPAVMYSFEEIKRLCKHCTL